MSTKTEVNRPSLVCKVCRERKVKCDKKHPCSACIKSKREGLCSYDFELIDSKAGNQDEKNSYRQPKKTTKALDSISTLASHNDEEILIKKNELSELKSLLSKYETIINKGMGKSASSLEQETLFLRGNAPQQVWYCLKHRNENRLYNIHDEKMPGRLPSNKFDAISKNHEISSRFGEVRTTSFHVVTYKDSIGFDPFNPQDDMLNLFAPKKNQKYAVKEHSFYSYDLKRLMNKDIFLSQLKKCLLDHCQNEINSTTCETIAKTTLNENPPKKLTDDTLNDNHLWSCNLLSYTANSENKVDSLVDQIRRVLPNLKVISLLVKRFFSALYPYMPFIDEISFHARLSEILKEDPQCSETIVSLRSDSDFSLMGTLIVMIKLSHWSLEVKSSFKRKKSKHSISPTDEYLLSQNMSSDIIKVAYGCLFQCDLTESNIDCLQCTLFLRLYHIHVSDVVEATKENHNHVLNSMLLQMAYSNNLCVDPDSFPMNGRSLSSTEKNLRRKIWHFLVINDVCQSFSSGIPMTYIVGITDSKAPEYVRGSENIKDISLDKVVTCSFDISYNIICCCLKNMLLSIFEKGGTLRTSQLVDQLDDFEMLVFKTCGSLKDYCYALEDRNTSYTYGKVYKAQLLISMNSFNVVILYHLFLHYESQQNHALASYYLQKLTSLAVSEMLPHLVYLASHIEECFGSEGRVFISPHMLSGFSCICEVFLGLLMRTRCFLFGKRENPFAVTTEASMDVDVTSRLISVDLKIDSCIKSCMDSAKVLQQYTKTSLCRFRVYYLLLTLASSSKFYGNNTLLREYKSIVSYSGLSGFEDILECGDLRHNPEKDFSKEEPGSKQIEDNITKRRKTEDDNQITEAGGLGNLSYNEPSFDNAEVNFNQGLNDPNRNRYEEIFSSTDFEGRMTDPTSENYLFDGFHGLNYFEMELLGDPSM